MSALGEWEDEPGESGEGLYFPNVGAFVGELLAPLYRRGLGGNAVTWCPEWWRHAEAIARLEALWRSWEHLRREPAMGMSTWFRDHADPQMLVLLSAEGPFKGCSPEKGHGSRLEPLPCASAPAGLFDGERADERETRSRELNAGAR